MDNIVFGIRPVMEAIEVGRPVEKLYIRKGAEGQLLSELKAIAHRHRIPTQEVPPEKLARLTRGNHQGVVARVSPIVYAELEELIDRLSDEDPALLVILDGVPDVRNFGGIARSAECAGAHGIIVPTKNGAPANSDAMKASAGALNRIPVCRVGSIRNTIKALQSAGLQIVGANEKSEETLYGIDLTRPTVLVMGNEERGISREVLKLCDHQAAIPQRGEIGSLNVGAAAAVLLFETVRQRTTTK